MRQMTELEDLEGKRSFQLEDPVSRTRLRLHFTVAAATSLFNGQVADLSAVLASSLRGTTPAGACFEEIPDKPEARHFQLRFRDAEGVASLTCRYEVDDSRDGDTPRWEASKPCLHEIRHCLALLSAQLVMHRHESKLIF